MVRQFHGEKVKVVQRLLSGFFKRVQSVSRAANPDVKVLLALGGWTDSGGDAYSRYQQHCHIKGSHILSVNNQQIIEPVQGVLLEALLEIIDST